MRGFARVVPWLVLLAATLSLAACEEEAPGPASPTSPPATPSPTATAAPTPGETATAPAETATPGGLIVTATPFTGVREPMVGPATAGLPPGGALLVDVRAARHDDFDRIVFEFEGGLPGYRVEYVEPPILQDASGLPVTIAGSAFLRVRFEPAAGHDPDTGTPTYTGPLEVNPALPSLLEAERTGDSEAILSWALGLTQEVDFLVYPLREPYRIAIDVGHPR